MERSWPAIIKFFIFKVENIVFADVLLFLHTTKATVLPYNRLCFQVQVKQFLGAFFMSGNVILVARNFTKVYGFRLNHFVLSLSTSWLF